MVCSLVVSINRNDVMYGQRRDNIQTFCDIRLTLFHRRNYLKNYDRKTNDCA